MAQNAQKADRNDDNSSATGYKDVKSTNMGVTYAITDSLTFEAASVAASGTLQVTLITNMTSQHMVLLTQLHLVLR